MRRLWIRIVCCFIFFLITGIAVSGAGASETFRDITAPEVRHLLDEGKLFLVHVLTKLEYDAQHIPGSVNIPVIHMETTDKLPEDKDTPLVFYCMGKR